MTNNFQIKLAAAGAGVRQWQIAERLGISEAHFCRKLRRELSDNEKAQIIQIILDLSQEVNA